MAILPLLLEMPRPKQMSMPVNQRAGQKARQMFLNTFAGAYLGGQTDMTSTITSTTTTFTNMTLTPLSLPLALVHQSDPELGIAAALAAASRTKETAEGKSK
uniref:Uncharacterized protein n=1 Tax=Ditylenchus dipsaci TaxID=166011 RepID=A0A915CQX9_9BILA